jgi:hypothetical protein
MKEGLNDECLIEHFLEDPEMGNPTTDIYWDQEPKAQFGTFEGIRMQGVSPCPEISKTQSDPSRYPARIGLFPPGMLPLINGSGIILWTIRLESEVQRSY